MKLYAKQIFTLLFLLSVITLAAACSKSRNQDITAYENVDFINSEDVTATPIPTINQPQTDSADIIQGDNLNPSEAPESTINNPPADSKDETSIIVDDNLNDNQDDSSANNSVTTSDDGKDNAGQDEEAPKKIIAIDAGHQSKGNYEEEPIGPGASETKPKVSSGTQGRFTGVPEYKLSLVIAKKVKEELINRGYEVVMIRETNSVNLSNKERADIANDSGADIFIRIHADGSDNPDVHGTSTLYPSKNNPYVPQLSGDSHTLAEDIVDAICENTGSKNRGAISHDDMSGINWSEIPVTIIEMGYMTNEKEDKLMQTEDYQDKIVQGICDGIDDYFD